MKTQLSCVNGIANYSPSVGMEEAQQSIQSLTDVVHDVLAHNQEICHRLERSDISIRLKHQSAPSALESAASTDDDASTLKPNRDSRHSDMTVAVERSPEYGFSFEQDLRRSRVYTRVSRTIGRRSDPDPPSLPSSAGCSMGSSFLSGLSLADVSNISLISLPISARSLSNGQRYLVPVVSDFAPSYLPHEFLPVPRSTGKILLLGISNSGKSTVLKQLQLMQGIVPTEVELEEALKVIRIGLMDTFRRILNDHIEQRAVQNPGEAFDLVSQYSFILHGSLKDIAPLEEYFDGTLLAFRALWKKQEIKWAINAKTWPQTLNNIP
ncbi:MAG: hypothetical protein Q9170_003857 [Blastenia crenularia]